MKLQDYDTGIGGSTTTISPFGSPQPTYRGAGSTAAATAKTNSYYMQVSDVYSVHALAICVRVFCV